MGKNVIVSRGTPEKITVNHINRIHSACDHGDCYVVVGYDGDVKEYNQSSYCIKRSDCLSAHYDIYQIQFNVAILPLDGLDIKRIQPIILSAMMMQRRFEERVALHLSGQLSDHYRMIIKHILFWNSFLEQKRIDIAIFSDAPHEVYDYILYQLCKIKKIKTYFYRYVYKTNRFMVLNDFSDLATICTDKYQECKKKYKNYSEIELTDSIIEFYNSLSVQSEGDLFSYDTSIRREFLYRFGETRIDLFLKDYKKRRRINSNKSTILSGFFKTYKHILKKKRDTRKLRQAYEGMAESPYLGEKYIYFALHLLPESAVEPLGGFFSDQFFAVKLISSYLPSGWKIYIKMHPAQVDTVMSIDEIRRYKSIENLRIISTKSNQQDLIAKSQAVATLTGEVAVEAFFKGIPCLLFGHTYYSAIPSSFSILTKEDIADAITMIKENKASISERERKLFFKALEESSYENVTGAIDKICTLIRQE